MSPSHSFSILLSVRRLLSEEKPIFFFFFGNRAQRTGDDGGNSATILLSFLFLSPSEKTIEIGVVKKRTKKLSNSYKHARTHTYIQMCVYMYIYIRRPTQKTSVKLFSMRRISAADGYVFEEKQINREKWKSEITVSIEHVRF